MPRALSVMIIKLEAEIDLTTDETRVKQISGDMWEDFGFWLEATGFLAWQAMKYKEWNEEKMEEYVKEYIGKCLRDYKLK